MEINELNRRIKECKKCRLSRTRSNAICGEGKLDAKLMLIAQAPGKKEDKEGKMFVGPSGKILDELLKYAEVKREEIYMTNLIKCMLPNYRKPKQDEIQACCKYLDTEIKFINPQVLIPLGYWAAKYIFEKYEIPLHSNSEFGTVCGNLFLVKDRKILPLPHPAAMLYNPNLKKDMIKKYKKLGILSRDCKWYSLCPMKRYYEEGKLYKKWIELYCKGDWESCIRYQMEGRDEPCMDWILPDGTIDEKLYEEEAIK
jgi:DNA polymerase